MNTPTAALISGERLHLHHGPIDLIIGADGPDQQKAFEQATARFQTLLQELVDELPLLRRPLSPKTPKGVVAQRMVLAVSSHTGVFVTPMAAVAGAVADEICHTMCKGLSLNRAYVNNGGDIAIHLGKNAQLIAAIHDGMEAGRVTLTTATPDRGLATSGWSGRSHSLGIADAVTVVAPTSAAADVAATLIANAVDLPDHPGIKRQTANNLSPDSDLGTQRVTTDVPPLNKAEINSALRAGQEQATAMVKAGLISGAALFLQNQNECVGAHFSMSPDKATGQNHVRLQTA